MPSAHRFRGLVRSAYATLIVLATISQASAAASTLQGTVQSNQTGLSGYRVSLYAASNRGARPVWQRLGSATSDSAGSFRILYQPPGGNQTVLFVEAEKGPAMLASALGAADNPPANVVINERTTVATATSYARFVRGSAIQGNTLAMTNAAHLSADLADPSTGAVAEILNRTPNGSETTTLATFNTIANAVAACVTDAKNCARLFKAVAAAGGPVPSNVLEAVAHIARYPSFVAPDGGLAKDDPLFNLART